MWTSGRALGFRFAFTCFAVLFLSYHLVLFFLNQIPGGCLVAFIRWGVLAVVLSLAALHLSALAFVLCFGVYWFTYFIEGSVICALGGANFDLKAFCVYSIASVAYLPILRGLCA